VKIKSQKDFFSGLMFTVVGATFAYGATNYSIGSGGRMGPGYFPLLLGVILAILGSAIMFKALVVETQTGDKIGKWAWKPLFFIIAANLLFGVLLGGLPSVGIPALGLIAAIFGVTIVASLAGDTFKLKEVLILSVVLSIGSYLAFIKLLNLQFPVWPTFIVG
jgi:Tripartite tricarboxylate transporter TctB family